MINISDFAAGSPSLQEFRAATKYFRAIDCLIYLREDVSYRAVGLDSYRTVLLHPHERRPVGLKLKGIRFLMERAQAVLRSLGLDTNYQVKLITLWELALTSDSDQYPADAEEQRKRMFAEQAKELAEEAGAIPASEIPSKIAA